MEFDSIGAVALAHVGFHNTDARRERGEHKNGESQQDNGGGDKGKRSQYIAQLLGLAPKDKGKNPVDSFVSGGIDSDLPIVLTEADFAKLKSGDRYIDSQGNRATKP